MSPAAEPRPIVQRRLTAPLGTKLAWWESRTDLIMDGMSAQHSAFWDDLARDLHDRRFRAAYQWASLRVAAVDLTVNAARWLLSRRQGREG